MSQALKEVRHRPTEIPTAQAVTVDAPDVEVLVAVLNGAPAGVLFVSEVHARAGLPGDRVEAAVRALVTEGSAVLLSRPAPDPHLVGDWRLVALVDPGAGPDAARLRAEHRFAAWLRDFLMNHRCT